MENIAASFSTGKEAYAHDIRKSIKGNVDKDRIQDNITLIDELQGKSIDSYIDSMMQPTIDEYNAKQDSDTLPKDWKMHSTKSKHKKALLNFWSIFKNTMTSWKTLTKKHYYVLSLTA